MIGADGDDVGRAVGAERIRDIEREGGQAAGMFADQLAVHPDGGVGADAFEEEEVAAVRGGGFGCGERDGGAIPRVTVEMAGFDLAETVVVVPVVREADGAPGGVVEIWRRERREFFGVVLVVGGAPVVGERNLGAWGDRRIGGGFREPARKGEEGKVKGEGREKETKERGGRAIGRSGGHGA
jgi:hypothetical protein